MPSADLVRIRTVQKIQWKTNPLSGHHWPEYGPITGYEVCTPFGPMSTHRSMAAAEKAAAEWWEFYDRHPVQQLS